MVGGTGGGAAATEEQTMPLVAEPLIKVIPGPERRGSCIGHHAAPPALLIVDWRLYTIITITIIITTITN